MMGNAVFQRRARELRERSGLTMEQLGEKLGGIKKSRINMWEFNGTVPREDFIKCPRITFWEMTNMKTRHRKIKRCSFCRGK